MAKRLLMVSPDSFGFNEQTAKSNYFQKEVKDTEIGKKAMVEFREAVKKIKDHGIEVHVFASPKETNCPDAVFPNNWISTHANGTVILYPMCTPNRRAERNSEIIKWLETDFSVKNIADLSFYENENLFLEGTGSIVFNHEAKTAYACISPRTNEKVLDEVCRILGYTSFVFEATDLNGNQIYHTNVVMSVGKKTAVVCLESISELTERNMLTESLRASGLEILDISFAQMNSFCGNILEVENKSGENYCIMSKTAFDSFSETQKVILKKNAMLLPVEIPVIENTGGGSARCMLAEIFLK